MRNAFAEALFAAAQADPRVCVIVADISPAGSMEKFRHQHPDRFINVGVAEQAMVGIAAGLAAKGRLPFCYTIATFSLYRPFEFIRDDVAYQGLPVTIVGMGAGLTYSTLGGTHHAQEDIAIASAIPGMTVLAPCDPAETAECVRWLAQGKHKGVYLRLGKAGEPDLTTGANGPWTYGKVRCLDAEPTDTIAIVTYGTITRLAKSVATALIQAGQGVSLFTVPTLKPLDHHGLTAILDQYEHIVVIEEHSPQGSLGLKVKALANDLSLASTVQAFSLRDEFIHCYGTHEQILAAHGLSAEAIVNSILSQTP